MYFISSYSLMKLLISFTLSSFHKISELVTKNFLLPKKLKAFLIPPPVFNNLGSKIILIF